MKVVGKILFVGPIVKQSDKDKERGLRFQTVFREEDAVTNVGGKQYSESLIYSIKSVDPLNVKVDESYLFNGKLWDLATDEQYHIRGLSNATFKKYILDESED